MTTECPAPGTERVDAAPVGHPADTRRYLAARVVACAGMLTAAVVLPVLVYRLTGSTAWTAAVAAAEALPYLTFGLLAGAVADRVDRGLLMIGSDLVAVAAFASIVLAWWAGTLTPGHVLVVAVVGQTALVVFDAANFGALPTLVGRPRLGEVYARIFGAIAVVELVVPPLAGLVLVLVAPAELASVTVITGLTSALLVRSIVGRLSPVPSRGPRSTLRADVRSGWRLLWGDEVRRTLTLMSTTQAVAGGAWIAMGVPWADRALGIAPVGDWRLALMFGCWGAGAFLAPRLVTRLAERRGGAWAAPRLLAASAVGQLAVVLAPSWMLALPAVLAMSFAHTAVVLNAIVHQQQNCPEHAQSRVNTTARVLSWGVGQPVGAAVAGTMATMGGGPRAGLAVGVVAVAAGLSLAVRARNLWSPAPRPVGRES